MGNCCIRRKYCELECIYPTSPLGDNCVRGLLFILSPFPFCLQSSREGPTTPPWLQIGGRRVVGINFGPHLWTPFSSPSLPSWTDSKCLLGALCVFVGWSWCPDKNMNICRTQLMQSGSGRLPQHFMCCLHQTSLKSYTQNGPGKGDYVGALFLRAFSRFAHAKLTQTR